MVIKPEFTQDFTHWSVWWPGLFKKLKWAGKPGLKFLEIGCYEGRTTLWLLENVLTHPSSQITVIDPFVICPREQFFFNLGVERERTLSIRGRSQDILGGLRGPYDFIYIDGDHRAAAVLEDAVLSWPLLADGGVLVFDDYEWAYEAEEWETPRLAIDSFVRCYHLDGEEQHGQYMVRK